jgi:hypothetical protein
MRRAKFRSKLTEEVIRDFIAGLVDISEVVADPLSTAVHTRDPDDDYLVALALAARVDVLVSGKRASDGQTISELSFGTVEGPLARLHVFRNRLAHHQRVWSHAPDERYEDLPRPRRVHRPALPG